MFAMLYKKSRQALEDWIFLNDMTCSLSFSLAGGILNSVKMQCSFSVKFCAE